MDNLNYIFFEEFKSLDKLCGELYKEKYGITYYINDMKAVSENIYQNIPDWNFDLKSLKHIRHIRNNLAHSEGAFNEEVCTQADIDWIKDFHNRILSQSDPISVLYQNTKAKEHNIKKSYLNSDENEQKIIMTSELVSDEASSLSGSQTYNQTYKQTGSPINNSVNKENDKFKISHIITILITIIICIILIMHCLSIMFT